MRRAEAGVSREGTVADLSGLLGAVDAGDELSAVTAAAIRASVSRVLDVRRSVGQPTAGNPFVDSTAVETSEIRLLLDRVSRFDHSGLGLLVGLHRESRRAGVRLVFVNPPPLLLAAMRRIGLHRILTIELDVRPAAVHDVTARDEPVARSSP
jgi:ABC-type transporter Mla MlaB component